MAIKDFQTKEVMFWLCSNEKRYKSDVYFRPFVKEGELVRLIDVDILVIPSYIKGKVYSFEDIINSSFTPNYVNDMFKYKKVLFDYEAVFIASKLDNPTLAKEREK